MAGTGAPLGNRNAAKGKRWESALTKALARYSDDRIKAGEALDKIALEVVRKALGGDTQAITEIANRLDGKALQPVEQDITVRECDVSVNPLSAEEWLRTYGVPAEPAKAN